MLFYVVLFLFISDESLFSPDCIYKASEKRHFKGLFVKKTSFEGCGGFASLGS